MIENPSADIRDIIVKVFQGRKKLHLWLPKESLIIFRNNCFNHWRVKEHGTIDICFFLPVLRIAPSCEKWNLKEPTLQLEKVFWICPPGTLSVIFIFIKWRKWSKNCDFSIFVNINSDLPLKDGENLQFFYQIYLFTYLLATSCIHAPYYYGHWLKKI